jgi:endoglucanase
MKQLHVTLTLIAFATLITAPLLAGCHVSAAGTVVEIRLNQVGFYPEAPKMAVVVGAELSGFEVLETRTNEVVFSGLLSDSEHWEHSGETVRRADFSLLAAEGEYHLRLEDRTLSHPFRIARRVNADLAGAALRAFYFQRASTDLPERYAGPWARPAGHADQHVRVHASAATDHRPEGTVIASPRGWYDAGDYNKYIVNSGISTFQVLAVYEHFPAFARALDLRIPESGGPLPDVLAEALWNVRWMLTMQDPNDGGVYHKLTNPEFDGIVMPNEASQDDRYVVQKSTAAALNFAAVMAQGSRIFGEFERAQPGLADSMRSAAVAAWEWALLHPEAYYVQNEMNRHFEPPIVTGAYGDGNVRDEFFWAASELFVTTGEERFRQAIEAYRGEWDVPSWADVGALGYYTVLQHRDRLADHDLVSRTEQDLLRVADTLRNAAETSAYRVAMGGGTNDFVWGSNAVAANQSMLLIQAYRLTADQRYLDAALSNLDYILGRNATGFSFVTAHGARTPMHPHHRPSEADDYEHPVPGMLAGGPNPGQQDYQYCLDNYGATYPSRVRALSYIDHWCSYASNEIAINWNAPLAYITVAAEALAGDRAMSMNR